MTSNVKSSAETFLGRHGFFTFVHQQRRSQEEATVDPAAIRGLGTT
jgi:hypothetical protein